jgi:hypothetical protein
LGTLSQFERTIARAISKNGLNRLTPRSHATDNLNWSRPTHSLKTSARAI